MTKDRDLIKIIVESSFILIGFILLFVSNLYPFAYGENVDDVTFYPSRLPLILQEIPINLYLIFSFVLYLVATISGLFVLNKEKFNKNAYYILITSWSMATVSLTLIALEFMLII